MILERGSCFCGVFSFLENIAMLEPIEVSGVAVEIVQHGSLRREVAIHTKSAGEPASYVIAAAVWEAVKSSLPKPNDRRNFVDELTALSFAKEEA